MAVGLRLPPSGLERSAQPGHGFSLLGLTGEIHVLVGVALMIVQLSTSGLFARFAPLGVTVAIRAHGVAHGLATRVLAEGSRLPRTLPVGEQRGEAGAL